MMYWYNWYGPWGWGFGLLRIVLMVGFWAAVIAGIIVLIRWVWGQTRVAPPPGGGETALDILKKRYARAEIGKEEFEQKKQDLGA